MDKLWVRFKVFYENTPELISVYPAWLTELPCNQALADHALVRCQNASDIAETIQLGLCRRAVPAIGNELGSGVGRGWRRGAN